MIKRQRKFAASFVLGALLIVASGFCIGYSNQAQAVENQVSKSDLVAVDNNDCNGNTASTKTDDIAKPINKNKLSKCCIERHGNTPGLENANFSGAAKIVATESQIASANVISLIENKLEISSDSSPPKPDKLSSILRLE